MRVALRVVAGLIPLVAACRDVGGPQHHTANQEHFSHMSVAVNLTSAPEVAQVRLRVTAPDFTDTLWFALAIHDSIASGTASVPPGPQRTFTLQALDSLQIVRYEGSATIDVVSGTNNPLTIVMAPAQPPGQVPIVGQIGKLVVLVTPPIDTLIVFQSTRLTAAVHDSTGAVVTGAAVTWQSLDTTVATVDSTGTVTTRAIGSTSIVAHYGGASGTANIVVIGGTAAPVATVTVSLNAPAVLVGQSTQATATLKDASGNVLTGRTVSWLSSDPTVATVSTAGLVTAVAAGTAQISATSEGKTGSAALSVTLAPVASVVVSLSNSVLTIGQTAQATAVAKDASGTVLTGRTVTWSSSDPTLASVSATGLVTAVAAGTAQITATSEGKTGSAPVTISSPTPPPPPSSAPGVVGLNCAPGSAPPIPNAAARTFYVDAQSGNDANAGTSPSAPWQTLAKANNAVQPGDYVYLKGTFGSGQWIAPNASGTATSKIVFAVWPGATAVLSSGNYGTSIYFQGKSHIVVSGLEITGTSYPIELLSGSNNIWLRNLYVHDNQSQISITGSSDNRLEDSRIERCGTASSDTGDCLWIADGASRNVITRNTMRYGGHGLISIGGDKTGMAPSDGNVVAGNDLGDIWAQNMGLIGYAQNTLVECNRLHDASTSGANYPRAGITLVASNNTVRYNLIYNNTSDGIQLQGYNFQGLLENALSNRVYNNTVYNNGGAALQISQQQGGNVANNLVENNVFWNNNTAGATDQGRYYQGSNDVWIDLYNSYTIWPAGSLNGNVISNNILGTASDAGKQWMIIVISSGNRYYTLAQAQVTFGSAVSNDREVDPLLNTDLSLQAGSPAVDAGVVVYSGQKYLGGAPDLGALERQ